MAVAFFAALPNRTRDQTGQAQRLISIYSWVERSSAMPEWAEQRGVLMQAGAALVMLGVEVQYGGFRPYHFPRLLEQHPILRNAEAAEPR